MKSKLIVSLVAATILVATVVLINDLYQASEDEVTDRFRANQTLIVRHLAQEIEQRLRDLSSDVQLLSEFASIQHRDTEMMAAHIHECFGYLDKFYVKAISVYDAKGTIICSTTREAAGQNHSHSDFFQWATRKENKGKRFISSLMRAEENKSDLPPHYHFLIVTPVYQEALDRRYRTPSHKFVGVLTFAIDLEEVVAAFLPLLGTDLTKEQVWIMDTVGSVLSHSKHPEMVTHNIRMQDETCMQCHVSFDYVDKITAQKQGTVEYALREQPRKLATFATLRYENASWIIVVNVPLETVSVLLQKQKTLAILFIGAMLIVLGGAFILFSRSNRLMIRAQEEAKQWREKRELENRIRESEERFRQVAESAVEWIWETDAHGLYTYSSSAVEAILGYRPEEIVGTKHFYDLFTPDVQEELRRAALAAFARKDVIRGLVNPNVHKNGSTVMLETGCVPILDERGDLLGYRGTDTDITARKRAEEALAAERSMLRTLIDNLPDTIYVKDLACRKTLANLVDVRNMGASSEAEVLGKTDFDFYPQKVAAGFHADDRSVIESGQPVLNREEVITLPDNTVCWQLTSKVPLRDSAGHVIGLMGIGHDITERRNAENALRETEMHYRLTVENAIDLIYNLDSRGCVTSANAATSRVLGYSLDNIIGRRYQDFVRPDFRKRAERSFISQWVRKTPSVYFEAPVLTKDGRELWFGQNVALVYKNGEAVGFLAVSRDITKLRNAEHEIRLLAQTLSSTKDCVSVADLDDNIVFVNDAFLQTYGYAREELMGQPVSILRAPTVSPEIVRQILPATLAGEWHGEIINQRKDGCVFPIELWTSAVKDDAGKIVATVGIARDITARKSAEQERETLIDELKAAIENVRTLGGLVPICAHCKKIRDDKGYWNQLEKYLVEHTDAKLTHGMCPDCAKLYFPGVAVKGSGGGENG